ncbi:MAG: VOC family protein [Pseudomonadota bacterium]
MDLNQVMLFTRDFAEGVSFYQSLGLRLIVSSDEAYARFEMPSGSSTLSLHVSEAPEPSETVLYFEVDDVDSTHEALSKKGIRFDSPPTDQPWRWREARFRDPTGNPLCLYHAGPDRRFPPWRLPSAT